MAADLSEKGKKALAVIWAPLKFPFEDAIGTLKGPSVLYMTLTEKFHMA